ncbi:hypothetical protein EUGRSUZ_C01487 [Eucalyptus grandis]|uniref:RNA-dependent RNA polymerase n=7 Tax=Eucalyptus grandis TaxID=71139 RepID=A0A059CNV4_EUCGR|nr:hypothetical protein EUGRSUZ_C01487 [Eucalyptus grandis]KAK3436742.1 hypothetical protein EUGRSUZ_C01487 [Eucalyptus grandis]
MVENAMGDANSFFSSKRAALRVLVNHGEKDGFTAARMILSGIPLDETYLQNHLSILMNDERKSLKGGRIPIPDSYYLMGTADPTGILDRQNVSLDMRRFHKRLLQAYDYSFKKINGQISYNQTTDLFKLC